VCVNKQLLPADVLVQKMQKVLLPQHTGFKVLLPGDVIHCELHTSDEPLQWQHLRLKEKDSENGTEYEWNWSSTSGIETKDWNGIGTELEWWNGIGVLEHWNGIGVELLVNRVTFI